MIAHGMDAAGGVWSLAAKGGHNDEHHNHNDCGGFIFRHRAVNWVSEIGAPLYTKDFFHGDRYRHLAARSLGHSVPLINGHEQSAGRDRVAVIREMNLSCGRFIVDITGCYPAAAGARSVVRHLEIDSPTAALCVKDHAELAYGNAFESAFITEAEAESLGDSADAGWRLVLSGRTCLVTPGPGTRADRIEVLSFRDHSGSWRQVRRVVFNALNASASPVVTYNLTPQ
jgi:hypothetical protein